MCTKLTIFDVLIAVVAEDAGLPKFDGTASSLPNVGNHKSQNTVLHPTIPEPSFTHFSAHADILSDPVFR